jgi:hypothetical protein
MIITITINYDHINNHSYSNSSRISTTLSGVDCFVMLGRGLAGTPNLSQAGFHGAR